MKSGKKIDIFTLSAVVLFSAVIGGSIAYYDLSQNINELEQKVNEFEAQEPSSEVGDTIERDTALTNLFHSVDQSVVSINALGNEQSQGSGFVYTSRGHIITNEHVVRGADEIRVTFVDGETLEANITGKDDYTDIAVLRVNRTGLDPLEVADSDDVEVGQTAVAIGNPFGLRGSMTAGIISQKERVIRVQDGFSVPNVLQTDAAINPGNSGGPLMNSEGEVVGVNTAIETRTGTFSGIGFAISSNTVREVAPQIIDEGDYDHPWIGVRGVDVDSEIAGAMNLENASGFLVLEVPENGPADRAGIRGGSQVTELTERELNLGGDVIVGINGQEVNDINDILSYLLRNTEVGQEVELEIIRDGERQNINLTLDQRPE